MRYKGFTIALTMANGCAHYGKFDKDREPDYDSLISSCEEDYDAGFSIFRKEDGMQELYASGFNRLEAAERYIDVIVAKETGEPDYAGFYDKVHAIAPDLANELEKLVDDYVASTDEAAYDLYNVFGLTPDDEDENAIS